MRHILIIAAALTMILYGCASTPSSSETVDKAYLSFDKGHYGNARSIIDSLVNDSAVFNELSVNSLCRLAQLCIRLDSVNGGDSNPEADEDDAMAARYLGRAHDLDADSVDTFIRSLSREQASRLAIINSVSTYLSIPRDSLVVEGDTIQ